MAVEAGSPVSGAERAGCEPTAFPEELLAEAVAMSPPPACDPARGGPALKAGSGAAAPLLPPLPVVLPAPAPGGAASNGEPGAAPPVSPLSQHFRELYGDFGNAAAARGAGGLEVSEAGAPVHVCGTSTAAAAAANAASWREGGPRRRELEAQLGNPEEALPGATASDSGASRAGSGASLPVASLPLLGCPPAPVAGPGPGAPPGRRPPPLAPGIGDDPQPNLGGSEGGTSSPAVDTPLGISAWCDEVQALLDGKGPGDGRSSASTTAPATANAPSLVGGPTEASLASPGEPEELEELLAQELELARGDGGPQQLAT